jgi:hypothetical protein
MIAVVMLSLNPQGFALFIIHPDNKPPAQEANQTSSRQKHGSSLADGCLHKSRDRLSLVTLPTEAATPTKHPSTKCVLFVLLLLVHRV